MKENQNIEFKSSWKDDYLKWICGFANANGGKIYIGKDDSGNTIGIVDAGKLLEEIPNKVKDILGILVDVNLCKTPNAEYIEVIVEPHPSPVNYKGQYHYRSGSTKQELKGAALDKFLLQKNGKRWDAVPVPKISSKELKKETFDLFKQRAFKAQRLDQDSLNDSDEQLLDSLHLNDGPYLKRAAILLFHPNPEKFITGAYIKIGFFKTDDDLIFQHEVHGNLFDQIEKLSELLFSQYIKSTISYQGIHRVEKFEYPKSAVREAILNAIAHKDYSGGSPIQISVYHDKLIVWNEGQLPENWTVKTLLEKHASRPFNPDIANALFRSGYIESWGRGTIKMINECKLAGIPEPDFRFESSDISVEFKKDIYNEEHLQLFNLTHRQRDALLFFKPKAEILSSEYAFRYSITDRTARYDLSILVEKGLLNKVGTKKSTKYLFPIKFR